MISARYSVGVVGFGRWGRVLASNVERHERLILSGICYRSATTDNRHYRSIDELLAQSDPDMLVIATPLQGRADLIHRALVSGKHVLTEKPLAENYTQALDLVKEARSHNLVLFTDFVHAYGPGLAHAYKELRGLGKLQLVDVGLRQPGPMYVCEGAMSLLGSHALAIIMSVAVSDSKLTELDNLRYHEAGNGQMACLDGFIKGTNTLARLTAHVGHPLRSRKIDLVAEHGTVSVRICGGSGVWVSRYPETLDVDNQVPDITEYHFDEENNLARVFDRVIDAIEGRESDNANLALSVQKVLDRCLMTLG